MHDKIKLLIVEDLVLTRVGLRAQFEEYPVLEIIGEAGNGEEAVKLAGELNPDVILMDIAMPVMDGIKATKIIKNTQPEIKILALTSHAQNDIEISEMLNAGANGIAIKDTPISSLVTIIKSVKEGAFWLDPKVAKLVLSKNLFNQA